MKLTIETEVSVIAEIITQFKQDMLYAGMPEEAFDGLAEKYASYACFLVMRDQEEIVGFIAFYCNDSKSKTAFASMTAIAEKYRGRGYGAELQKKACEIAAENGMTRLHANVRQDNIKSINMCLKAGMTKQGITEYGEFLFEKEIEGA